MMHETCAVGLCFDKLCLSRENLSLKLDSVALIQHTVEHFNRQSSNPTIIITLANQKEYRQSNGPIKTQEDSNQLQKKIAPSLSSVCSFDSGEKDFFENLSLKLDSVALIQHTVEHLDDGHLGTWPL